MAPKKKPVVSKKSSSSGAKTKKKSSGGGGLSLNGAITLACLVTVVAGGLIIWRFNASPVDVPAASAPPPPPAQAPAVAAAAVAPANAPQSPPAVSPAAAGPASAAAEVAAAPMVPLKLNWFPASTNLIVQFNAGSVLTSPLGTEALQSPYTSELQQVLSWLRTEGFGEIAEVAVGFAVDPARFETWKEYTARFPQTKNDESVTLPDGIVGMIRFRDEFQTGFENPDFQKTDGPFSLDGDSSWLLINRSKLDGLPPLSRHLIIRQAEPRVALLANRSSLDVATSASPSAKFPPVPADADVVIAITSNALVPSGNFLRGGDPADPEQAAMVQALSEIVNSGADSFAVSLSVRNGLSVVISAASSRPEAATALLAKAQQMSSDLQKMLNEMTESAPEQVKSLVQGVSKGISTSQADGVTTFAVRVTPQTLEIARAQLPALLMGGAMAGAGGPGMMPMDSGPMQMVDSPLHPATEAIGLESGFQLSASLTPEAVAAVSANSAAAPGVQLRLTLTDGFGAGYVQYRNLMIQEAVSADGTPWKVRSQPGGFGVTSETWNPVESIMVSNKGPGSAIPLVFEPAKDLAKLSGEVELRTARLWMEHTIQVGSNGTFAAEDFASLDLKMVAGTHGDAGSLFLVPNSESTEILSVQVTGGGPLVAMPAANQNVPENAEPQSEPDPEPMSEPDPENQTTRPRRPPANAPVATIAGANPPLGPLQVRRIPSWNPRGFQVNVKQAGKITLKLAKELSSQTVTFKFENLPAPASGAARSDWSVTQELGTLPKGFTGLFVRGARWDGQEEGARGRRLVLTLDLTGPAAERVVGAGIDRVSQVESDLGKKIEFDDKAPGLVDRPKQFDQLSWLQKDPLTPRETYRHEVPLLFSEQATSLNKYVGEFRIQVATARETAVIGNLASFLGKSLQHDVLKKATVTTVKLKQDGTTLSVTVPKAERQSIAWIDLLNADGVPLPQFAPTLVRSKVEDRYDFKLENGAPSIGQLKLRMVVNTGVSMQSVPFSFEGIPLPR